jgi:hypothetical protein
MNWARARPGSTPRVLTAAQDGARQVWLYATILTVGYMVSRGLAKSGSRGPYDADEDNR